MAHLWAKWLRHPCRLGDPHRCRAGGEIRVAHLWAKWLRHPCRLRDPHRFRSGGEIRSGPLVGKVAMSPLPSRGSPPLQSGGGESEVAHLWAKWLCHPCRLGDPHRCRAGGGNQKWPTCGQSGYVTLAVSGIPTASERGGGDQKWPTCGQSGYVTPAVLGIPTASERGGKSEVAHLWAKWLCHPCRLKDPHRFRAEGGNEKWPTCGQSGYVTLAVSGIPTAVERGGKIRSGPLVGQLATSALPSRGSPPP